MDREARTGVEREVMRSIGSSREAVLQNATVLQAREFLRSRIIARAQVEGAPLSELELRYLDNTQIEDKSEWKQLEKEFARIDNPLAFQERMAGYLRRAYEADLLFNPTIRNYYLAAVDALKESWPDSELWAIAVPALAERDGSDIPSKWWIIVAILFVLLSGLFLGFRFLHR